MDSDCFVELDSETAGAGGCVSSRGTKALAPCSSKYSVFNRALLLCAEDDGRNHRSVAGRSRKKRRGRIAGRSGVKHCSQKWSMSASSRVFRG